MSTDLATVDWIIIAGYLALALVVGAAVSRAASTDLRSYFQASRSLPWWWAGTSIAATMFAADTPLAVTGIVATQGMSGNWIWLSWAVLHVAVVCFFADRWHRSAVLTDAELIDLRYSGRWARVLRALRSILFGVVINAIILGWVLRAMTTIAEPYLRWERWTPGLVDAMAAVLPANTALGQPGEAITIVLLVVFVGLYSVLGGIRGVILTDLLQLVMALVGSIVFAVIAADAAGGLDTLAAHPETAGKLALAPTLVTGLTDVVPLAAVVTALYLFAQSVANNPADGGGFLMQRLGSCKSPAHARAAAGWFVVLQYLIRPWPWFIVAAAALVLIPVGSESTAFGGSVAGVVDNREGAYSALIAVLLPAGVKGLLLVSLLAAFMSTVDTHINWGASYLANDLYKPLRPAASDASCVAVARLAVVLLAVVAIVAALYIGSIERAWQTLAAIGAGVAAPTVLRWLWWRVNALSEIVAMVAGLLAWIVASSIDLSYEVQLVVIAAAGLVATVVVSVIAAPTAPAVLATFRRRVEPLGWWPDAAKRPDLRRQLAGRVLAFALLCAAVYSGLFAGVDLLFSDRTRGAALAAGAIGCAIGGWRILSAAGEAERPSEARG